MSGPLINASISEDWKNWAAVLQSVVTAASFVVGGVWVYRKYVRLEKYPNIEFSADVEFIGVQDHQYITELTAIIENKGKAQLRISDFSFDLNAIEKGAPVGTSERWGGQVDFPKQLIEKGKGSFLPKSAAFFFIDPGVKAKFLWVASVPTSASFVILHCWFKYSDEREFDHTAERTVAVPKEFTTPSLAPILADAPPRGPQDGNRAESAK